MGNKLKLKGILKCFNVELKIKDILGSHDNKLVHITHKRIKNSILK